MTAQEKVSHPPVSHPQQAVLGYAGPGASQPAEPATKPTEKPTSRAGKRKLPPPQVLAAAALAVAALELLLWQVGGIWWGVLVHAVLAAAVLAAVVVAVLWRRRSRRRSGARGGSGRSAGAGPGAGRPSTGKAGRSGGKSGTAAGARTSGGKSGGGRPGGGRRPAAGGGGSAGGLLGRFRRSTGAGRPAGGGKPTSGGSKRPAKGTGLAGFVRGFRESTKPKNPASKNPSAAPKHPQTAKPEPKPTPQPAPKEKPQQPKPVEQLVKEAIKAAADTRPAPAAKQKTGGTAAVANMETILAAAEDFAAALKKYDPEDMHQLVREMPHLAEAFTAVSGGISQIASRAESEWPVAGPVVEGLRTMASDVQAAAGTAEETRGTIRRENEVDIERGEAPRHGSHRVEAKWNVTGNN